MPLPQRCLSFISGLMMNYRISPYIFPLKTRLYNDIIIKLKSLIMPATFRLMKRHRAAWNYYNGKDWLEFGVEDDTTSF